MTISGREIKLKGIGVSPGIVIGKVFVLSDESVDVPAFCHLDKSFVSEELVRFERAVKTSKEQLERLRSKVLKTKKGREHVHFIDAYLLMLEDEMLVENTMKAIKKERVNAEWALKMVLRKIIELFDKAEDEYMRDRGSDIEHIGDRILSNLIGVRKDAVSEVKKGTIIVARSLAPTDTVQLSKDNIRGFITVKGGKVSHTAIIARSLEIPAVVGIEDMISLLMNGDTVIVDGTSGTVVINPSLEAIREYEWQKRQFTSYEKALHAYRKLPAVTIDGENINLLGNLEFLDEITQLLDNGAEGIGLYRTEFLYLGRDDMPTEEEHFAAYKEVVQRVFPHPTTIRTFDLGGDKIFHGMNLKQESNPAMGLRSIRLSLKMHSMFKTQLKAILQASSFGKVKVMFPMISGIDEFVEAKEVLEEAEDELRQEGKPFDPNVEIGVMIEVPSAALIADHLAKRVSFFSIGTNDLLQYCLAIDRGNDQVNYLYEPLHPALLKIIKEVVDSANRVGIEVSVCGEIAGEPMYAMALIALGLKRLSMNAISILRVKKMIRKTNYNDLLKTCDSILDLPTAKDVERFISEEIKNRFGGELL